MVVEEPVPTVALATALEVTVGTVEAHLHELGPVCRPAPRVHPARGGRRLAVLQPHRVRVDRRALRHRRAQARLTQAALETLAVVAYLQPVSRARIGSVRGVNVESVLRTLVTRGLVGARRPRRRAILYATTGYFLERLGLRSLDELPPIAHHLPDADLLDQLAEEGRDDDQRAAAQHTETSRAVREGSEVHQVSATGDARGARRDVHEPSGTRLQKLLAAAGVGSRRTCEGLIAAGRVQVDGQVVTELGTRIDLARQVVHVDGVRVQLDESRVYLAFNKPRASSRR